MSLYIDGPFFLSHPGGKSEVRTKRMELPRLLRIFVGAGNRIHVACTTRVQTFFDSAPFCGTVNALLLASATLISVPFLISQFQRHGIEHRLELSVALGLSHRRHVDRQRR